MRIILVCGKGGVGKSGLAAALGVRAAEQGQRTLVYSVDPAHSLAWTFDQAVGTLPTPIAANLWAAELEALAVLDEQWGEVKTYVENVMRSQGLEQGVGKEVGGLPGVQEFAALVKLKQFADSEQFDVIVVDHAPTALALRLLTLPDAMSWYAQHGRRIWDRYGAQAMMYLPMLGASVPMPNNSLIGKVLELAEQLRGLPALLADPVRTSARLVLTADELALDEARDLYAHLSLYGITTDQVLINQVLPAEVSDPFFTPRREREKAIKERAHADFKPLHVHEVKLHAESPKGLAALGTLGHEAWPAPDVARRHTDDLALRISQEGGGVIVDIKLPFVAAKDVDLAKFESELYITIGQHRRILALPPEAADMQPVKAKFAEGRLLVTLARTT